MSERRQGEMKALIMLTPSLGELTPALSRQSQTTKGQPFVEPVQLGPIKSFLASCTPL